MTEVAMRPYFHIHHSGDLIEWSANIKERIAYIKAQKPAEEIETRLKWMTPVQGKLPKSVGAARAEYGAALAELDAALAKLLGAARAKYGAARAEYGAARAKLDAALANNPALEALHAAEHPGCPWDGHTLFPKKGEAS